MQQKKTEPRTGFGGKKERTGHAGALAEDEDGVVGRGTEGADVPLGAPAVVVAQPERLVEERVDGAGLVETAPGADNSICQDGSTTSQQCCRSVLH